MSSQRRRGRAWVIWLPLYVATLALVTWGMFTGRKYAVELYGTPEAQSDWDQWVEDVREEGGEGPVRRRVPRAPRPPALVLMQDQFVTCLVGALVLSSAMFATVAFFVHGVLTGPRPEIEPPSRDRGKPKRNE
jgi:hypothetical protein